MPEIPLQVGETNPKTGALQDQTKRISGLRLFIPAGAGVSSIKNDRIVTVQEDSEGNQYAVLSNKDEALDSVINLTIVRWGIIEESLQSGGLSSISPDPNTYVDGDIVTVMSYPNARFQVLYDGSNKPGIGIASARVDVQGRLTSVAADSTHIQLAGAVSAGFPGLQLSGQLRDGCLFYQMNTPVVP